MNTYTIYRLSPIFIAFVLIASAAALVVVIMDFSSDQESLPLSMIIFGGYVLFPFIARTFFLRRVDFKIAEDSNGFPTRVEVYFADFAEEETVESYAFEPSAITSLSTPASDYGKLKIGLADGTSISLLKHHLAARDDDFTTVSNTLSRIRENVGIQIEEPANWYSSETVSFMRRFGSLVVDGLFAFLIMRLILAYGPIAPDSDSWFLGSLIFSGIFVFKDAFFKGRSLGKRLFGIRIASIKTGENPALWRIVVRNLVFMVTVLNIIEFIVALFKPQRRIGDYLAGTRVIRMN